VNEQNTGMAARHSSATAEHYTPPHVVEAARATLGAIDLDPFSCAAAQRIVRAELYYSPEVGGDGWALPWRGRVFCNPPGGRSDGNESSQKRAWFHLAAQHDLGRVTAAIFICFSIEGLQFSQVRDDGLPPMLAFPFCVPSRRLAYTREDGTVGKSPPHASAIIYLPPPSSAPMLARDGVHRFRVAFGSIGRVVVPA
jgi:ParB family chromosome partitioning protein